MRLLLVSLVAISALAADLPNRALTPGATLTVAKAELCRPGYPATVRNVPESEKRAVYAAYGIAHPRPGQYEVDHLISLELGGSNEIANLWPQSYVTKPWNAHLKDKLENHLHALMCAGTITLADAQHSIAEDWVAEYRKVFDHGATSRKGNNQ
jgi:hypothetical protein